MSEDHQWRQLGSIVNAVLIDAKTRAIRTGALSKAPERPVSRNIRQNVSGLPQKGLGNGFLAADARTAGKPVQLELPFGIAAAPQTESGPRAPRTARLV